MQTATSLKEALRDLFIARIKASGLFKPTRSKTNFVPRVGNGTLELYSKSDNSINRASIRPEYRISNDAFNRPEDILPSDFYSFATKGSGTEQTFIDLGITSYATEDNFQAYADAALANFDQFLAWLGGK